MAQWLRGAGGEEPDRGVEFQPSPDVVPPERRSANRGCEGCVGDEPLGDASAWGRVPAWAHRCRGEECKHGAGAAAGVVDPEVGDVLPAEHTK
eukprot:6641144-Prymnesium_polylepis.1